MARWLQQAPVQHEAAWRALLPPLRRPISRVPSPAKGPLSAAAAVHGFGSGRHLTRRRAGGAPAGRLQGRSPRHCRYGWLLVEACRNCCLSLAEAVYWMYVKCLRLEE